MIPQTAILAPPEFSDIWVTTVVEAASLPQPARKGTRIGARADQSIPSGVAASIGTASSQTSTWVRDFAARVQRLRALSRGWDGPQSEPVKSWLLNEAARLVRDALANSRNSVAPFLVPGGDGSVQIEWHTKSGEIELDLGVDGTRSIWIHDRLTGDEAEATNERAIALFSRWAPRYSSANNDENHGESPANTSAVGALTEFFISSDNSIT